MVTGTTFPGILLSCPPRAGTLGERAHLVWPDWSVRLDVEEGIVAIIQGAMRARFPDYDWAKIIESPPKMRSLFSDTIDKQTGHMANRPMQLGTAFDDEGRPREVSSMWNVQSDIDLLRLCSLRLDGGHHGLAALLPIATRSNKNQDSSASAHLAHLSTPLRAAVLLALQRALEEVRLKHRKPNCQFYPESAIRVYLSKNSRKLTLGIMHHRQCAPATTHDHNNVMLILHMDRNEWELRCFKLGCAQRDRVDSAWGQGQVDTSALRAAWPSELERQRMRLSPIDRVRQQEPVVISSPLLQTGHLARGGTETSTKNFAFSEPPVHPPPSVVLPTRGRSDETENIYKWHNSRGTLFCSRHAIRQCSFS